MTNVIIPDTLPLTQIVAVVDQTVFSTSWTANVASDVVVYYTPVGTPPDDATQLVDPSLYQVDFIGSQQDVQVTLAHPADNTGDLVTITRETPADYLNLYTNTNFLPSMLNNDFGILTLVDQQAQLINQQRAPRYNFSAELTNGVDNILPVLGNNQFWIKNSDGTALIAVDYNPGQGTGSVSEVDTGTGLQGGPITISGTISLAEIPTQTALVNISDNPAIPTPTTLTDWIDNAISLTQGSILYRNATEWVALAPGTFGYTLQALGAGGNVEWAAPSGGSGTVDSGLAQQLTYYAADGTEVSGLTTTASAALLTDSMGNLEWVAHTGTGAPVLANTPTLVTPILGTPTSGTLTNCTGLPIGGLTGLGTGVAAALAANVTGSGGIVLATSPTLVTPFLGTPTSGNLVNCTGLPIGTGVSGLGTGIASFLAVPSSANLLAAMTTSTGSGNLVFDISPTLVTPALGTPSSVTLTNGTGLPIAGLTGLGTGVAAALAVNVGSAGAFVTFNGALGTPNSGTLTNCTGLPVAGGGTGNSTFTAYSVICAGTTATGAFQNVSGVGTSGYVLTSNGASALPTWQAASGSGIGTIDGDSGSATGSTVNIHANATAGSSVSFSGSSATISLNVTDSNGNTIIGLTAGRSGITGLNNNGHGAGSLNALTSGTTNQAHGNSSLGSLTTGSTNIAINGLATLITGSRNIALNGGGNYTGSESNNILLNNSGTVGESNVLRISASGTGNQQVSKAFIGGIYNVSPAGTQQVALIGSGDQVGGSSTLPTAIALQVGSFNSGTSASSSTFWRGDGTWATPSGSSLKTAYGNYIVGTGIAAGSSGITSISNNSTGNYTVNWTTAFASQYSYVPAITLDATSLAIFAIVSAQSTTAVTFQVYNQAGSATAPSVFGIIAQGT
jgi:hypothetical protein